MTTAIREARNRKRKPVTIDGQWTIAHPTKTALAVQGALIEGSKGASKPPAQYVPVEAPQSLRSKARGRILDLIAHGPIVGLVNGLQSILLDETPLQNPDGTFNFEGVVVQTREGYPDQAYIPGFTAVENSVEVNAEIKFATPIVRSVTNNDANAVIVTVAIQGLTEQKSNGDLLGYKLPYAVDVRQGLGAWTTSLVDTIDGKTTTTYQRSSRIPLNGPGPFDIRVRRTTEEAGANAKISDDLYWSIMTEVIDARLNYPDSALVAIDIDAELFGSKMPARYYDMELSIIKVPSNYNPRTREYTGFWDGTFKLAWSDNPAWCYYDLATHPVIGANNQAVDKWSLYRIAQYCDGMVPDGYGGMERRFSCNTLFASREEAITTLNTLASVWRGMVYWGAESVMAVGDMPGDVVKLVTPANITSDGFEYVGTSLRERHSVAVVMWNDPNDGYKQVPEMYEDPESIQLFGWRETQVTAACCTSRGQARRLAKWILYSERMETEIVSYTASTDHSDLRPGDFIKISDPDRAGVRLHGRIKQTGVRQLTLDKAPANLPNETWYLSCVMPSGTIQQREVLNFNGPVVTLKTDFPEEPIKSAVFILSSAAVVTPTYRVMSVIEQEDGVTYQISATEHNPNKYDFVEFDLQLPPTPDSTIPSGPLAGPETISVTTYKYITGGAEHQALNISWSSVDDVRVTGYILEVRDPDDVGYRTLFHGNSLTVDEKDVIDGEWLFRVKATTATGRTSEWVNLTANVAGLLFPAPPDTVTVETTTFEATVTPRNIYPNQMYEFWRSDVALAAGMIESNAKRLAVGTNLVDVGLKPDTTYYYYVRGTNIYGFSQFVGAQGKTKNDFDDILNALDTDIRKPGGLFDEMVNSVTPGIENAQQIAAAALAEAQAALAAAGGWIPRMEVVEDGITDLSLVDELQAVTLQALRTTVEGFQALVSTEEATRITEDAALASRITTVKAETDDQLAVVTDKTLVLASADQTLAQQITTLDTKYVTDIGENKSAIDDEKLLRTTADAALASRLSLVESAVGTDLVARITQEETTRASQTESLAQQITQLSATNGAQFASIAQTYSTVAYADTAVARAITTVTVNGKKAVFGISVDGEVAEIGAIADRFYVYNPVGGSYTLAFAVANGQTVIQDGMIRDASIGMAKITGALQSDNFIPGILGWRLSKTGLFENNGDTEGSGRMTQTNQAITVFDTAGNRKVQLGKLS
ncbi:tail protein [Pseudomonas phage PMBT3]|uniref:Tail fiber protein n=1 Tax=Pseudomonas phage PMBT3 TaxID=2059856 RepID=A0A2I6PHT2_9CAUD|nr:tail protein [Pseudomonas phage PMBT3]AUM59621.1 tail fiber protein [Pseudomonas phage PMBT3]